MHYSFESKIRYSELDEDGKLSLNSIINYFQDCSIFHSDTVGRGMEVLAEEHRGWVLSSWQIVIDRYPGLGEEVLIETWPYDFKGFMGYRNFVMKTSEGEMLACANTLWSFLDTDTGIPVKVKPEDEAGYGISEKLQMDYAPRKVAMPKEYREETPFVVQKHHLDTNHHVNNGQYVQMARDFLPEGFIIRQMRAEYKRQAVLNDRIYPKVCIREDLVTAALCSEEGNPYAVIEFMRQKKG